MAFYTIFTDSACDIPVNTLREWNVGCVNLTFRFDGQDIEYSDGEIASSEFYDRMRQGGIAKTSAINTENFKIAFTAELEAGHDIIYIGFSSGLSTTYNSARLAAQELSEQYPERKILTIDSLAASAGFGLLIALAAEKRDEGADIQMLADYVTSLIPRLCHWFTVDDLVYLKRGGRVSPTVAFVGNLLGIKPVLHVDDEGHLINMTKVRGRRAAIMALAQKYGELHDASATNRAFISHGDCEEDAKLLKQIVEEKYGAQVDLITPVGTVIGAHSGPGTLAFFFLATQR